MLQEFTCFLVKFNSYSRIHMYHFTDSNLPDSDLTFVHQQKKIFRAFSGHTIIKYWFWELMGYVKLWFGVLIWGMSWKRNLAENPLKISGAPFSDYKVYLFAISFGLSLRHRHFFWQPINFLLFFIFWKSSLNKH